MTEVNLFLVGAAKSGTTSLSDYFSEHPDIFVSPIKEPNHFGSDIRVEKFSKAFKANTHLDEEAYFAQKHFENRQIAWVRSEANYRKLFAGGSDYSYRADCSTSYLYSRLAASEIAEYNPEARIVILLRNPISRAFSHYLMALKYGFTDLDFRSAVESDRSKPEKGWGISELFLELGNYAAQIQRFLDYFPKEQIFIRLTEDLASEHFYDELCDFLEVEYHSPKKAEKSNEAGVSRLPKLNKWMTQNDVKKKLGGILPKRFRDGMKKIYYTNVNLPTLSESDRQYLIEYYADDIYRTAQIIDRDLEHWTKPTLWK